MADSAADLDETENAIIEQIIELQRDYYFENKGRDTERRRRLRELIDHATPKDG